MLLLSVLPTLYDWARMQFWEPVPAQLLAAELREKAGSKSSTTYLASAQYRYLFADQPYAGRRVAIGSGADNIGNFQQQLGQRLEQALAQGAPVTAWVNPTMAAAGAGPFGITTEPHPAPRPPERGALPRASQVGQRRGGHARQRPARTAPGPAAAAPPGAGDGLPHHRPEAVKSAQAAIFLIATCADK